MLNRHEIDEFHEISPRSRCFLAPFFVLPGLRFWHEAAEQHGSQRAKAQAQGEVGSSSGVLHELWSILMVNNH